MLNENILNESIIELNDEELEEVTGGKGSGNTRIVASAGKSNVRSGPGLDYKSIGVLHLDESAKYLGSYSTDDRGVRWFKISWNGRSAWVSSRYTRKK